MSERMTESSSKVGGVESRHAINQMMDSQRARRESSIGSSTVDVSWVEEYGLRQKLSRPIRCF